MYDIEEHLAALVEFVSKQAIDVHRLTSKEHDRSEDTMQEETIRPLWMSLLTVRSAIADKLFDEGDRENRTALFEAHQAVGYALLHLERVEFLIDADLREKPPS